METVLWTTAETSAASRILCQPYIPGSAAKLLDLLAVPADERDFAHVADADALVPGTALPAPEPVFPRYVDTSGEAGGTGIGWIRNIIVEANSALVAFCRRNAAAARPAGAPVIAIDAAIAYGADAEVEFLASDAFLGSRLARRGEPGTVRVAATTLRQVLQSHAVGEFDLVCDIEGVELDLLRSDAGALSRCHLAIIEMHPDVFAELGASEADFLHLLAHAGLDIVDREANVIAARNRAFARRNKD